MEMSQEMQKVASLQARYATMTEKVYQNQGETARTDDVTEVIDAVAAAGLAGGALDLLTKVSSLSTVPLAELLDLVEDAKVRNHALAEKEKLKGTVASTIDAPLAHLVRLPEGEEWVELRPRGTFICKEDTDKDGNRRVNRNKVMHVPFAWTGRVRNLESGTESVRVVYQREGEPVRQLVVPRTTAFDSRKIMETAAQGFPVTSLHTYQVVEVLEMFEVANPTNVPASLGVERMGWHEHEGHGFFVLGDEIIGATENMLVECSFGPEEASLANAVTTKGSWSAWVDGVATLKTHHAALMAVYVSVAGPLLEILDRPGFVLHYAGETSTGKSTVVRVGASVWGHPRTLLTAADATTQNCISRAIFFNDIAVLFDDVQTESDRARESLVYRLAQGVDRGRNQQDGTMRRRRSWRGVAITTGEQAITDGARFGGVDARVLQILDAPLPPGSPALVNQLDTLVGSHYGHLGRRVIERLVSGADHLGPAAVLDAKHEILEKVYADGKVPNNIVHRQADLLATVLVAARVVHEVTGWEWNPLEIIVSCFLKTAPALVERDPGRTSYEETLAWVAGQAGLFESHHHDYGLAEERRLLGVLKPNGWDGFVGIRPDALREFLTRQNYPFDSTLRLWKKHGWLRCDDGHLKVKVKMGGQRTRLVVVKLEADDQPGTVASAAPAPPQVN